MTVNPYQSPKEDGQAGAPRSKWSWEPGVWLGFCLLSALLAFFVLATIVDAITPRGKGAPAVAPYALFLGFSAVLIIVAIVVLAAIQMQHQPRWCWLFSFIAAGLLAIPLAVVIAMATRSSINLVMSFVLGTYSCVVMGLLVAAALRDWVEHRAHSWPHWCGVLATGLFFTVGAVWLIAINVR